MNVMIDIETMGTTPGCAVLRPGQVISQRWESGGKEKPAELTLCGQLPVKEDHATTG